MDIKFRFGQATSVQQLLGSGAPTMREDSERLFERQRRYSEIGERLLEDLPSVAREPISAAGSIRPNGGRLLSSPITGNERWLAIRSA
jgi:hypothetical protein